MRQAIAVVNTLIPYDTKASGAKAVNTCRSLRHSLDRGYCLSLQLWRFDWLDVPEMCQRAACEAAQADIVLVAWSCATTALSSRRTWTEQWPTVPLGSQRALVALFTGSPAEIDESRLLLERQFLQALAERTGMDLICSPALAWHKNSLNEHSAAAFSREVFRAKLGLRRCRGTSEPVAALRAA